MNWKPVHCVKNRGNVLLFVCVRLKTSSGTLYKLPTAKDRLGDDNIKCVAVVKS